MTIGRLPTAGWAVALAATALLGTVVLTAVGSVVPEEAPSILSVPTFRLSPSGASGPELNVGVNAADAIFVGAGTTSPAPMATA